MTQLLPLFAFLLWAAMLSPILCQCNISACRSKIPPKNATRLEQCTQAKDAIVCAQTSLLSNPNCTENIKMTVRQYVERGRKQMEEECGGRAAGLIASLLFSLGLSILTCLVTVFQSRTS